MVTSVARTTRNEVHREGALGAKCIVKAACNQAHCPHNYRWEAEIWAVAHALHPLEDFPLVIRRVCPRGYRAGLGAQGPTSDGSCSAPNSCFDGPSKGVPSGAASRGKQL